MTHTTGLTGNNQILNALNHARQVSKADVSSNGSSKTDVLPISAEDTAKVSTTGSVLAGVLGTSDVRMEKVDEIKSSIEAGTYSVSSSLLADKLIDAMRK